MIMQFSFHFLFVPLNIIELSMDNFCPADDIVYKFLRSVTSFLPFKIFLFSFDAHYILRNELILEFQSTHDDHANHGGQCSQ